MNSLKVIIGLGNPGTKYQNTPHNLGRRLIEFLAQSERASWSGAGKYDKTDTSPSYIKLNTYMNVSGEPVNRILKDYSIKPEQILVCYDDFDLPLGTIRIKKKGSAGTHNGLKSVIEHLNTKDIPRLRLGVGPIPPGRDPADYVLRRFNKDSEITIQKVLSKAQEAIQVILKDSIDNAMNQFNGTVSRSK